MTVAEPISVSYRRAIAFTLIVQLITVFTTVVMLSVTPIGKPVLDRELVIHFLVLATVIPVLVAFPISILVQRREIRLAQALRELAAAHARLAVRARTDALTGTLNREAFLEDMNVRRQTNASGALLMIDVDHFKSVNDTYGHQAGDEALKLITRAMRKSLRRNDLIGRMGGEEFAVFLSGEDKARAHAIAERIRHAVSRVTFRPKPGIRHRLTISVGLAFETAQTPTDELIGIADKRLYEAKNSGRNKVTFDQAA